MTKKKNIEGRPPQPPPFPCPNCGEPVEQIWLPNVESWSTFKTCAKCRTKTARDARAQTDTRVMPFVFHEGRDGKGGQNLIVESKKQNILVVAGNGWGKDVGCMGAGCIWFSDMLMEEYRDQQLLTPRVHMWILAPQVNLTDQNWRYFLRFFPSDWIVKIDENERKIRTIMDGLVEFKSTTNPNALVSVGLDILLWTEIAQSEQQDKLELAWANLFSRLHRPGRGPGGTGGRFLGNSCVVGDTLITTGEGIREIQQISDVRTPKTYVPAKIKLAGFAGEPQESEHFFVNGESETRKIKTRAGYSLEGTPNHPIWVMGEDGNPCWRRLDELKAGDWVAIRRGANVWGNDCDLNDFEYKDHPRRYAGPRFDHSRMTPDLAYLMGMILGDGYIDFLANKVIIAHSEDEQQTIDFLLSKPHNLNFYRSNYQHTEVCNKEFVEFLEWYGFEHKRAKEKTIPRRLFSAPRWAVASFLSGLFDADGHARSKNGRIGFNSTSERLIEQVQFLLLNFGITSKLYSHVVKPTKRVKAYSYIYTLEIPPKDSRIFFKEIGFRLTRKQSMVTHVYTANDCKADRYDGVPKQQERMKRILKGTWFKTPSKPKMYTLKTQQWIGYPKLEEVSEACACTDAKDDMGVLKQLHDEHYFWDRIKSIEIGYAETFDFVIPTTHAFVSNGFISHNTPNGLGLFHSMYLQAKEDPDNWDIIRATSLDSPYTKLEDFEKAKKSMPDRLFKQLWLAEFPQDSGELFANLDTICSLDPAKAAEGRRYFGGWDPASPRGEDFSVFVIRDTNGNMVHMSRWSGVPWNDQVNRVAELSKSYNHCPVLIETVGIGEHPYQLLSQTGVPVTPVRTTNEVKVNLVNNFAVLCEKKIIGLLRDDFLIDELRAFKATQTPSGKITYGAPKHKHDDTVMATMIAYKDFNEPTSTLPFFGKILGVKRRG